MMHRHKKIIYGILIICMVFVGIFGSGNLLRDGERTSSEPGDTEETATTQVPVITEQTAGEETCTNDGA